MKKSKGRQSVQTTLQKSTQFTASWCDWSLKYGCYRLCRPPPKTHTHKIHVRKTEWHKQQMLSNVFMSFSSEEEEKDMKTFESICCLCHSVFRTCINILVLFSFSIICPVISWGEKHKIQVLFWCPDVTAATDWKRDWTLEVKKRKKRTSCIPSQWVPLPVYPALHVQRNDPWLLAQSASEWQLWTCVSHSSMSVENRDQEHDLVTLNSKKKKKRRRSCVS